MSSATALHWQMLSCLDSGRLPGGLLARGAQTNLWQAAALGLLDRLTIEATPDEITNAFWCACHGGQREAAAFLLDHGAQLNWVGYDGLTPLQAAERSQATELVRWLRERGAH